MCTASDFEVLDCLAVLFIFLFIVIFLDWDLIFIP